MEDVVINYLSILLAAAAIMGVGALWYGPVFGKHWMKMKGYTEKSMKEMKLSANRAMTFAALGALVTAFALSLLFSISGPVGLGGAIILTIIIWLGFTVPLKANDVLFEGGDVKLFLFHIAENFIALLAASIILTIWK